MSETELLDLERRHKQATLAPWTYSADPDDVHEPVKASNRKGIWSPLGELRRAGDGAFIATVRNVLPRLLSGIRAARAEAEHLREQGPCRVPCLRAEDQFSDAGSYDR